MTIAFDEFVNEAIESDIRVVIITSRKKSGGYYKTSGKIKEMCEKMGLKSYVAYAEEVFLDKDDEGKLRLHNTDDGRGFRINKNNTVAIIRNSVTRGQASLDFISQLERYGVFCVNSRECIEECYDKYRTYLKMSDAKISTPKTALISSEHGIDAAFKKVGGKFPCVIKTLTGEQGVGVFIVDSQEGMKSTLQTLWKLKEGTEVIVQEFLEADYDMRIHILGGKYLAGMKRFKIKKDFRSNYSLGGSVAPLKITNDVEELAILAAKCVGATWTGVDILKTKEGKLYVLEINASPGTEGIEKASKVPITKKVIQYITNKDNWFKKPTECGYIEMINVEAMGDMKAKMDTGNGSYSVIHSNKWEIKDNYVKWTHLGKEYEHKLDSMKNVRTMGKTEERPVVLLNVTFNGDTYKDVKFTISNRETMSTPILLNRTFIKTANLVINPAKRYALSIGVTKDKKEIKESTGIKGWFNND